MKVIRQLFWIILFSFIGECISILLKPLITVPGSVIGMVCLFLAFRLKWLKVSAVEDVGNWLTSNMALFFIPAGVGLMTQFSQLGLNVWWQLVLIILVTTTLMMIAVGKIVEYFIQKQAKTVSEVEGGHSLD